MRQYERSGVVVDQCSECRGIFLDRGELEKLVDAEQAYHGSTAATAAPAAPAPQYQQPPGYQQAPGYQQRPARPYRDHDSDEYPVYQQGHQGHPRKKKSFLGELFD
jgi:Zn-finger nucleic acid-binding protein